MYRCKQDTTMLLIILFSSLLVADVQSESAALDKQIADYQAARDAAQMKADLAGRNADRVMQQDWMEYRKELQLEEAFELQVADLNAKIADLEKRKARAQKG